MLYKLKLHIMFLTLEERLENG